MKKKITIFSKIPAYKNFIYDRDQALEHIHANAQKKISDILRPTFYISLRHAYFSLLNVNPAIQTFSKLDKAKQISDFIDQQFNSAAMQIEREIKEFRKNIYAFIYLSELAALTNVLGRSLPFDVSEQTLNNYANRETRAGGQAGERMAYYLRLLRRKLVTKIEQGLLLNKTPKQILENLLATLPPMKKLSLNKPKLRKLHEADEPKGRVTVGFISADQRKKMVDEYLNKYIPKWRTPDAENIMRPTGAWTGKLSEDFVYAWQVEKEATQELLDGVGEVSREAQQDAGINDWIYEAVIDNKVCDDCCLPMDGMLYSEFKDLPKSEQHCGFFAPLHFNCRCRVIPVGGELAEKTDIKIGGFQSWLEQMQKLNPYA